MPAPTTKDTAERCWDTCVAKWGEAECKGGRQQCGFPYNNATGEHAGIDRYVSCVADSLGGSTKGSADHALREAGQRCGPGR